MRRLSACVAFLLLSFLVPASAWEHDGHQLVGSIADQLLVGHPAKKQVESILGPPTTVDTKDFVLLKKTTYVYAQGKESVTIVFKDDKVQSKASTLSE